MLPHAEMIISLAKEFGIPLTDEDYHDTETSNTDGDKNIDNITSEVKPVLSQRKIKLCSDPLDMENELYDQIIEERKKADMQKDFICANIVSFFLLFSLKCAILALLQRKSGT